MAFFILLLPNTLLLILNWDFYTFFLSFYVILFIYSIFGTTRFLFLFSFFYLLIPLYLIYISLYGSHINENHIGVIYESNIAESSEFLSGNTYLIILSMFFWLIFLILFLMKNYKKPNIWKDRSRLWVFFSTLILILSVFLLDQFSSNKEYSSFFLQEEESTVLQNLKKTYPLGLVVSMYDLYDQQNKLKNAFHQNIDFKFNAKKEKIDSDREIYVLLIGETSRRANWSLNNYDRITNPKLSNVENLVNLSDMLAVSSATRESVPMILTRKKENQVFNYDFKEKSIISAFKEAGFKTFWLSTQQELGRHDTSTSVYAREADKLVFLNQNDYLNKGILDGNLIYEFDKILMNKNDKKIFVVIHMLGSHYDYAFRYPKEFNIFRPSLNDLKNYSLHNFENKMHLINSYDNSILYSDYVLHGFIELLNRDNSTSFLFYTSDHGESIFDGECDRSGHGHKNIYNFEVASFIWYSKRYKENNFQEIDHLNKVKNKKINHTSVFPTLIDAAKISIPDYDSERSLLKNLKNYPRIVLSTIDYDKSIIKGVCREFS